MHSDLYHFRRRGTSACRDTANQLTAIRRIVAEVAAVMSAPTPGETDPPTASTPGPEPHQAQLFDPADLQARLEWARGLAGDTQQVVLANLKTARELGPLRRVASPPSLDSLDALARDFPHCSAITALLRRRIALAHCSPRPTFRLPPLLLSGEPGCGKTAIAKRIAALAAVPHGEIDMATVHSVFTVAGLDIGYATGRPGRLWELLQNECMSPMIILDELDKARSAEGDDVVGFLYALLEPLTARRFCDAAIGLVIDASRVSWIATCNNVGAIDAAILSRFTVVEVPAPTTEEMPAVIDSIHRDLMSSADWAGWFDPQLSAEVVTALASLSPRMVGRAIEDAYASAASAGRRVVIAADVLENGLSTQPRRRIGFIHSNSSREKRT